TNFPRTIYSQSSEIRDDFKKYYAEYQVKGSFVLYDRNADKFIFYNKDQFEKQFTPASTFKICNSLIGLETGVITNENYIIPWDSVKRNSIWDKDFDLKNAFKNSTVWYYQELARRVGGERMKQWLDTAEYGNADTLGSIDKFWLTGGLRITPSEQIDFMIRLNTNKLPFSQRSVNIVKDIMIEKDTLGYVLRGKSGWGSQGSEDIGWFVGFVEANDNVYYFANCVQTDSKNIDDKEREDLFNNSRRSITYQILKELNITDH
ncbi:MAG: class D beta-lactamase, partial [Ignavibacteria bacterium]|nr:class D beta-lactamase [Ignavibacteria bacterium]